MDYFISFACDHADISPWIFTVMILLAGFNIPISIDIIMIIAGALVGTCSTGYTIPVFILLFLACWVAAWEAYWVGRFLGPKLYEIKWFKHIISREKIEKLHFYYEHYGIMAFMIGRFIPGGVRNALFMTCGLGKMPFLTFILRDLPACFLSTGTLYWLGYIFGQNVHEIVAGFKNYQTLVIVLLITVITLFVLRKIYQNRIHSDQKNN